MKTSFIITLLLTSTLFFACDEEKNTTNNANNVNNINNINNINNVTNPQLVSFNDSGCKNSLDQKAIDFSIFSGFECVVWAYDGIGSLDLRHVNAVFNCCPDETLGMTGTVAYLDSVFTLTESDNGGLCNCVCPYDMVYTLSDVAPGSYSIVVDPFEAPVDMNLSEAAEGWFCIDRLLNSMTAGSAGERGSFCELSSECMGGDGYCLTIPDYSPVCVNTCISTLDCPMPDLEECLEDLENVWYCSPVSTFNK
ncbi:hypothetical protein KJ612_13155 [Myxococcota bacterium]|nr:hypothetical protein [Myxococcota bacterium]